MLNTLARLVSDPRPLSGRTLVLLLLAYLAVRLPFLLTHHVQEDAYIAMRAGLNFFEQGVPSFNVGERHNPVTSVAWALVLYVLGLFSSVYLPAILLVDLLVVFAAALVCNAATGHRLGLAGVVLLLHAAPVLWASYNGMETCLALLYVAYAFYLLQRRQHRAIDGFVVAFLPLLIRPDFGFVFVLFCLCHLSTVFSRPRYLAGLFMGGALGLMAFLAFNQWSSGQWLPVTALAKNLAYTPSHDIAAVLGRYFAIFSSCLMLPEIKFIPKAVYLLLNFLPLGFLAVRQFRSAPVAFLYLVAYGFAFILAYAGGGFLWYFLPSAMAIMLLYLLFYVECLQGKRWHLAYAAALVLLVLAALPLQFLKSLNTGFQEFHYRAGVGRWLAQEAQASDTLLLEPAGYIPFYSGLHTYDEVGLVSADVFRYMQLHGQAWWPRFVQDVCPTYLVERFPLVAGNSSGSGYQLNEADAAFIAEHYALVKTFTYRPEEFADNALLLRVLKLGYHSDYLVYRRLGECGGVTPPPLRGTSSIL